MQGISILSLVVDLGLRLRIQGLALKPFAVKGLGMEGGGLGLDWGFGL